MATNPSHKISTSTELYASTWSYHHGLASRLVRAKAKPWKAVCSIAQQEEAVQKLCVTAGDEPSAALVLKPCVKKLKTRSMSSRMHPAKRARLSGLERKEFEPDCVMETRCPVKHAATACQHFCSMPPQHRRAGAGEPRRRSSAWPA